MKSHPRPSGRSHLQPRHLGRPGRRTIVASHDRRLVCSQARHPVAQHARCENVRAVDHQGEGATATGTSCSAERHTRRRARCRRPCRPAEVAAEALDVVGRQSLVGRRTVVDDEHLVIEIVDTLLVGPRQRVQRASGLAAHVVEDDRDGEVEGADPLRPQQGHGRAVDRVLGLGGRRYGRQPRIFRHMMAELSMRSTGSEMPRRVRKASTVSPTLRHRRTGRRSPAADSQRVVQRVEDHSSLVARGVTDAQRAPPAPSSGSRRLSS